MKIFELILLGNYTRYGRRGQKITVNEKQRDMLLKGGFATEVKTSSKEKTDKEVASAAKTEGKNNG